MPELAYTVVLHPNSPERGYAVEVPALPGCVSYGETPEEAVRNVAEAIALHLEGMAAEGLPIPQEDAQAIQKAA